MRKLRKLTTDYGKELKGEKPLLRFTGSKNPTRLACLNGFQLTPGIQAHGPAYAGKRDGTTCNYFFSILSTQRNLSKHSLTFSLTTETTQTAAHIFPRFTLITCTDLRVQIDLSVCYNRLYTSKGFCLAIQLETTRSMMLSNDSSNSADLTTLSQCHFISVINSLAIMVF